MLGDIISITNNSKPALDAFRDVHSTLPADVHQRSGSQNSKQSYNTKLLSTAEQLMSIDKWQPTLRTQLLH
jgi:hypothetical protein